MVFQYRYSFISSRESTLVWVLVEGVMSHTHGSSVTITLHGVPYSSFRLDVPHFDGLVPVKFDFQGKPIFLVSLDL